MGAIIYSSIGSIMGRVIAVGMVEKTADGKLVVPFTEIRADFMLRAAA